MSSHIRPIDSSEKQQWSQLFQSYADFYSVDLAPQAESQAWSWIHDEDEDFWCDIAVSDKGELVGFVQYQLMHRSLSGEKVCYLSDLFVDPS